MRIQYQVLHTLFFAALLLSFPCSAENTNAAEVKKESATEKSEATPKPKHDVKQTQEPVQSSEAAPQQSKPEELQPTQEAATSEAPPDAKPGETVDESKLPDAAAPKEKLPFAKGDMEVDLSVALAGTGNDFYFGVAASYGYYVANRFAVGLYLQYTHIFSDSSYDYKPPESIMFLPFVKFAITRSKSVSPYIFVTGGYEGKWTYNAKEGFLSSPNGWLIGAGGGVYVGITKNLAINIRLLGAYKWYSDTQIYRYKDSDLYHNADSTAGGTYKCEQDDKCNTEYNGEEGLLVELTREEGESGEAVEETYYCYDTASCKQVYDKKDKKSEWLFPLITIGITFFF